MLSRSRAPRPTDLQMLDAELEIVQEYSQTIRLDKNAGWALFNQQVATLSTQKDNDNRFPFLPNFIESLSTRTLRGMCVEGRSLVSREARTRIAENSRIGLGVMASFSVKISYM